jgi:hypothetical protein
MPDQRTLTLTPIAQPVRPSGESTRTLTLRAYSVTPTGGGPFPLGTVTSAPPEVLITLTPFPIKDRAADAVCYLYPLATPAKAGGSPETVTVRAYDATPSTVILVTLALRTVAPPEVVITLRPFTVTFDAPPAPIFPVQYAGLRAFYRAAVQELCLVAQVDAPAGVGGRIIVNKNGTLLAVYLVDLADANASPVRVATGTGVKAIRVKT